MPCITIKKNCHYEVMAANRGRKKWTFDGSSILCQVCGDKASGFHYGVHACEGCKPTLQPNEAYLDWIVVQLKSWISLDNPDNGEDMTEKHRNLNSCNVSNATGHPTRDDKPTDLIPRGRMTERPTHGCVCMCGDEKIRNTNDFQLFLISLAVSKLYSINVAPCLGSRNRPPFVSIPERAPVATSTLCHVSASSSLTLTDLQPTSLTSPHNSVLLISSDRRSIQQKIQYRPCTKNQQCSIIRINRNRCQYCRLKKCIAVGMSRDAVRFGRVPKREKAKIIADMQRTSFQSRTDNLTVELEDDENIITSIVRAHADTSEILHDRVLSVLDHYRKMAFDLPISTVACPFNPSLRNCDKMSDKYLPAIRSVVNFAKGIPGFHLLMQDDQVTLLKATAFEILLLRSAPLFDTNTKTLLLLNGTAYSRDRVQRPLTGKTMTGGCQGRFLIDSLFDFMNRFNQMQLSEAEVALFSAVVLVSPGRTYRQEPSESWCLQRHEHIAKTVTGYTG
ncbi:unnamed protein product [Soboliphyme baturini]|uniref:Nuclear receptor domain-containing protein n=1 Tax=Soboliphyme baturini TaxID=241478 RepID=A0A183IBS8_9BILA|nr:unnamed protein product [Soboliphyme baturini]